MKDRRQTHGFITLHIKSGDLKVYSGYHEESNSNFRDNEGSGILLDYHLQWGNFDNLTSQHIKFYTGMHYMYQLLYVLHEINSFCTSRMLDSIDQ